MEYIACTLITYSFHGNQCQYWKYMEPEWFSISFISNFSLLWSTKLVAARKLEYIVIKENLRLNQLM